MKRFQFRLQSVLEHRQRKETIANLNFAQAQGQLMVAQKMLSELEEIRDSIIAEVSERRLSSDFDPTELHLYHEYLKKIKQCLNDQLIYVNDLSSTAEALRLHLVGASQERQVLDHMKSKAESPHQQEYLRSEQVTSDDQASVRRQYMRTQAGQE